MTTKFLMSSIFATAVLAISAAIAPPLPAQAQAPVLVAQRSFDRIEEAEVLEVLEAFFIESENLSVDNAVVKYTAPFVLGDFTVLTLTSEHRIITQSREDLRALLEASYGEVIGVRHLRRVVDIEISEDGQQALAEDDSIIELTLTDGSRHLAESLTLTRFALVNGSMTITSIVSESIMDIRPELLNL